MIGIAIMAAMGAGIAVMVATNQVTRNQQLYSDQAFYTTHAGFEYALGQIDEGSSSTSMSRDFKGDAITITRTGGKVNVSTTRGNAQADYSITDPNPPSGATCLDVDVSAAVDGNSGASSNQRVEGIVLSRNASCSDSLTITQMIVSWVPNLSERLRRISIDSVLLYNSLTGLGSGSTFDITDKVINDFAAHPLDYLFWNTSVTYHNFTITFVMSDASTKTVNVNFLASDQASCLTVSTTAAALATNFRDINGMTLQNTCTEAIRMTGITTTWTPSTPARTLQTIRVNGSNIYNSSVASGVEATVDLVIPASTTYTVNYFRFSAEMLGRNYTFLWEFADSTTTNTTLDLFSSNQGSCFTLNKSAAVVGGTSNREIQGMTIQNACSADMGLTGLTVSWTGEAGRRTRVIRINAVTRFNGSSSSGTLSDFGTNDVYLQDGSAAQAINYIRFNNAVTLGLTFNLVFSFIDGTTYSDSVTINAMSNSFSYSTTAAQIGGTGDVDLLGVTISNTGSSSITVSTMVVTWTGGGSRRVRNISINGTVVWSGNSTSGATLNITDTAISAAQTFDINYIRFNGDMSTRSFTLRFNFTDGSSVTTASFTPPDAP